MRDFVATPAFQFLAIPLLLGLADVLAAIMRSPTKAEMRTLSHWVVGVSFCLEAFAINLALLAAQAANPSVDAALMGVLPVFQLLLLMANVLVLRYVGVTLASVVATGLIGFSSMVLTFAAWSP